LCQRVINNAWNATKKGNQMHFEVKGNWEKKDDETEIEKGNQSTVYVVGLSGKSNTKQAQRAVAQLNSYFTAANLNANAIFVNSSDFNATNVKPVDAVAVVGATKKATVDYIKSNLPNITSEGFKEKLASYLTYSAHDNPEVSDGNKSGGYWGYVIATTTEKGFDGFMDFAPEFRKEALAITIFHGMGHTSGLGHGVMLEDAGIMNGASDHDLANDLGWYIHINYGVTNAIKQTFETYPTISTKFHHRYGTSN
jgi:hypothetical protein